MFDGLVTRWEMGGLLNDKRELKSPKDANWRGYVVKIGTLHGVFEALCGGRAVAGIEGGPGVQVWWTLGGSTRHVAIDAGPRDAACGEASRVSEHLRARASVRHGGWAAPDV